MKAVINVTLFVLVTSLANTIAAQVVLEPPATPPAPRATSNMNLTKIHKSENEYTIDGLDYGYSIIKTQNEYSIRNNLTNERSEYTFESIKPYSNLKTTVLNVYDPNKLYFEVKKNKLIGIIDNKGRLLIPMQYQSLNAYCAKKQGKYGVVNLKNEVIIPFIYENLSLAAKDKVIIARLDSKTGIIDKNGNILVDFKYDHLSKISNHYFTFLTSKIDTKTWNNSYGLIDINGKVILDEKYRSIEYLFNDYFSVKTKENLLGVYKENFGFSIQPIYDQLNYKLGRRSVIVKKDNKFGLLSVKGEILIEFDYDSLEENEIVYKATKNNRYGFIGINSEKKYEEITDFIFDKLDDFSSLSKIKYTNGDYEGYLRYDNKSNQFEKHLTSNTKQKIDVSGLNNPAIILKIKNWDTEEPKYFKPDGDEIIINDISSLKNYLPQEAKSVKSLIISLDENLIENQGTVKPIALWKFKNLQFLQINDCKTLPIDFSGLSNLKTLYFKQVQNLDEIPFSIIELKQLEHLIITHAEKLKNLPKSIFSLLNLKTLKLYNTNGADTLSTEIKNLEQLEYLEVNNCSIHCPKEIGDLKNLKELHIYQTTKSIPFQSIYEMQNLEVLGIHFEKKEQLKGIGKLQSLRLLKIRANFPTPELSKLKKLEGLILHGRVEELYSSELSELKNLQALKIGPNSALKKSPEFVNGLLNLKHLEFFGCNYLSLFTADYGNLESLQNIKFYRCGSVKFDSEFQKKYGHVLEIRK